MLIDGELGVAYGLTMFFNEDGSRTGEFRKPRLLAWLI